MSCELLIFFFILIEHLKALFSVDTGRFHRLYQNPPSSTKLTCC